MPGAPNIAYLKGGPCAGKTHTLTPAEAQAQQVICNNGIYDENAADSSHRPYIVFDYKGRVPGSSGTFKAPRAHGGWNDLRKSLNHHFPNALRHSHKSTRAALRSLGRARKVRL